METARFALVLKWRLWAKRALEFGLKDNFYFMFHLRMGFVAIMVVLN